MKNRLCNWLLFVALPLLIGCGGPPPEAPPGGGPAGAQLNETVIEDTTGSVTFKGEAWADNWFAVYLGEDLLLEDSVSIDTERSFNAESFTFQADYPLHLNFILKDFTLFLHVFVQTEAVSIHFEHFSAKNGHFYSNFGL